MVSTNVWNKYGYKCIQHVFGSKIFILFILGTTQTQDREKNIYEKERKQ